jgi:hypothetical protein
MDTNPYKAPNELVERQTERFRFTPGAVLLAAVLSLVVGQTLYAAGLSLVRMTTEIGHVSVVYRIWRLCFASWDGRRREGSEDVLGRMAEKAADLR